MCACWWKASCPVSEHVRTIFIQCNPHDWMTILFSITTIIIIIHSSFFFNIALFSALEQTHCAHVKCDSEWVTISFYSAYYQYSQKWCTGSAVWLLHGWCHVNCCHLSASSVYIIQPCTSLQSLCSQVNDILQQPSDLGLSKIPCSSTSCDIFQPLTKISRAIFRELCHKLMPNGTIKCLAFCHGN